MKRRAGWSPWRGMALVAAAAAAAAGILCTSAAAQPPDRFDEHLTLRPLPDGRLHTLFSFELRSGEESSLPVAIYSTVPRSLIHLAKVSDAEEIHLAINAGRWDYERWGEPEGEEMVGTGAEVWARLGGGEENDTVSAGTGAATMVKWRKLTANLAGLFCASLDALDERLTVEPFSFRQPGSPTRMLHALLSSESICTENLSTLLKLLPCKTMAGLASLLKPHKLFTSDFHGMTLHMQREADGWKVMLSVQAIFAPVMQPDRQKRDWSLNSIFGTGLHKSCPLASKSAITVVAPPRPASRVDASEDDQVNFAVYPIVVGPAEDDEESDEEDEGVKFEKKARRFAKALQTRGHYTFDTRASSDLNVEMKWTDEEAFTFPSRYRSPPLLLSRSFSGYGQERGRVDVVVRNAEPIHQRTVTYFEVLPWFIKPYLHTLSLHVDADEFEEEQDNLVRFQDDLTAPLLLSLDYSPSLQRQRPFHMEATLRIPPQSTLRLSYDYDKSFLRFAEHPPDAHRGFDVAPAIVLREDGSKVYTNPGLIEVAVPDFSMPYNVIIFTSTLVALCAGSTLNNLLRRYTDVLS